MPTAARSYLRAQGLPTSMASLGPGPGPVIDSAFTAPEFDIKAWINAALDSYPRQPTPSSQPAVASSSPSSTLATDASLDASLDLLQTPALDPVLDEKSQENQDLTSTSSLVTSPLTSLSSRKDGPSGQTQLQGSPSSLVSTSASQSQTTLLTQHATSHLTKLHLYANQISTALTSVTQDMVKTLPRLGHELDQLRQETSLLQEGIKLVRNDIHSIDSSDTAQALDRLKYLDLVKTRMEATHASLREAENWRNLEAEANEILARGDFIKAATRLSEAERSLVVYKNTNVEGDRMALLLVLKDQLEQQVKAKVKEALEQKDTAACQMLISVFGLIGRRDRFQEYYIAQRRAFLLTQWKRSMDILSIGTSVPGSSLTGTSGEPKDFVGALQTFYNDASTMLHDEFTWITSIFADPPATIHSLVHDIFTRIDPNMHTSLRHIVRSLGDEGSLPVVIAAFTVTESFGTRMERIVTQPLIGNQRERSGSIVAPRGMGTRARSGTLFAQNNHHLQPQAQSKDSTGNTGKDRRLSRITDTIDLDSIHQDQHEWAYILYEPFMSFQRDYGKLEAAHLHALVVKSVPAMAIYTDKVARDRELAKASSQLVKIMTTTNNLVFTLTEGAIGRCMRLTHGFGAQGLLDGLNGFFKEILDRYTEILMECRRRSGLQVESTHSTSETLSANQQRSLGDFGGGHSRTNSRNESKLDSSLNEDDNDQSEDSEGWDEDISEKEQRHFQMGLRLMVLCRQFCLKLEQLDLKTKRALRGVEELVKLDQTGGHSLSGNSAIQEASAGLADQLGVGVGGTGLRANAQLPGAVVALLQQSNLNSFRLSEILATVKASDPKDDPQHPHPTAKNAGLTGETMNLTEADRFATGGLDSKTHHLFLQSHQRAVQFTKLCQRFIFDSIYIPLVRPLKDLALQPCWTEGLDAQSGQDQGVDDGSAARRVYKSTLGGTRTDVIKFRSGPSEYMEELLKHLRSLPSTFGVYEGDIGLRFGIQALPYADRPADAHHQQGDESVSSLNMDGTRATTGVSGGSGAQGEAQGLGIGEAMSVEKIEMEDQPALNEEEDSDSAVMHRWITSLSRAAMHALIEQLYDPAFGTTSSGPSPSRSTPTTTAAQKSQRQYYLTRLSESGAKQLETDLGYFVSTYLGSLAIEPTPSFQSLLRALSLGEAGLLRALQQLQQLRQQHQQQQNEEGAEGDEGDEEREDKGKRAKTSGGESVAVDREQASILVPGGPVLPTVLTAGHEDELEQLEQEQKIFEWVARLKGIAILSL